MIVFAIACCALGTWQLNRRAEALAEVARIDANYDAEAVPVAEALPDPAAFDVDQRWQVVALSGTYLADEEVVVRNRPFEGSSGFEVITPFRLDDGTVFMVDRGWIAQASDGRPSEFAAPPAGQVEVDGAAEGRRGAHRGPHVHRHRVRHDRPRRARRARGRAELHRRLRRARAVRRRCRRAAARRGPARCATRARTSRTRCSGSSSRCSRSSGSAGRRTRSGAGSRRHPEPARGRHARASAAAAQAREGRRRRRRRGRDARPALGHASSMSSWYSRLQWSSVPSGMISTRSGFSASTAPGSCETSTTEPS